VNVHTLEVASGPTFRLIVAPHDGPDPVRLIARLRWPTEDGPEQGVFEPARAVEPYTKADELPWVRLPPLEARIVETEALEVRTTDGLWRGECAVKSRCGDVPDPVEVQLTACASLEGVVHDSTGAIVAGAQVSALYEPALKKSSTRTTTTDREGHYRLDFMRAGSVTLSVKAMAQSPAESPCALTPGQSTRADFTLTALPVVGSIRGIVTSDSGNYDADDIRVSLVSVENPGPKWRTKPHWETRRGARVATFAFDGLPAGKFIVEIEEHDWFEWEPRSVTTAAPRDDVELRVHDRPRIADLVFHVTDSDNGRVLDDFHVTTTGAASLRQVADSDEVVLTGFRLDLRLNWRLDRAGYPPSFGSLASFNLETTVNGRPRRTVELNLRPGWGDHIQVVRKQNNKPIADAVVFIDGVETTVHTDKNGYADIVTRDKPKSVTISAPGWKQSDPFDLRPPSKRNWRFVHQVQMDPLPKKK
jgi:hypothetical protein